jgi:hypothetical protein
MKLLTIIGESINGRIYGFLVNGDADRDLEAASCGALRRVALFGAALSSWRKSQSIARMDNVYFKLTSRYLGYAHEVTGICDVDVVLCIQQ